MNATAARPGRPKVGWPRLLATATLLDVAVLVGIAVRLGDRDALALAGLALGGLGLLRMGRGRAGRVFLALFFANIVFWTIPGAASNLIHREEVADVVVPASLAVVSMAGFVAPFALVVGRMGGARSSVVSGAVLASAMVLALMLTASALVRRGPRTEQRAAGDIVVVAENTAFDPADLAAGGPEVAVVLANRDLFWHTFTIDALGVDLKVPVGGERRVAFPAPPGTYAFYCKIPGHELAGMKGSLVVGGSR